MLRFYASVSMVFMTFTLISWVAVGTPVTTTRFLWFVQDAIAIVGESFSNHDYDLRPEIDKERREQEKAHDNYSGYYKENRKKVGSGLTGEYDPW